MLFSEATLRRVFATTTAATVGQVNDLIVDPHGPAIAALRLDGARHGDILHWSDIACVGPDAITVASPEAVRSAEGRTAELLSGGYQIMGKRLLTKTGDDLGRVMDVDFDPRTGSIRELVTTGGRVDGGRLVACGSYAAVVGRDPSPGTPAPTGREDDHMSWSAQDTGRWPAQNRVVVPAGAINCSDRRRQTLWVERDRDDVRNGPVLDQLRHGPGGVDRAPH
jgi:uncharacterized protein YrrD